MQHHRHHPKTPLPQPVLFIATMRPVAENGVSYVSEVLADLVKAPGPGMQFYQAVTGGGKRTGRQSQFKLLKTAKTGLRLFYFSIMPQGVVDPSLLVDEASDDGEIGFPDLLLPEKGLHYPVSICIFCKEQHTRGFAVQAMDGIDIMPQLVAQLLQGRGIGIPGDRRRVHQQTVGFIDGYKVVGFVEDR